MSRCPEFQRWLGHESIQTTVDVYGGILDQAGDLADAAIDQDLSSPEPDQEIDAED